MQLACLSFDPIADVAFQLEHDSSERTRPARIRLRRILVHQDPLEVGVALRIIVPQRVRDAENVEDEALLGILLLDDPVLHGSVRLKDREKARLLREDLQREELRRARLSVRRTRGEPEQRTAR